MARGGVRGCAHAGRRHVVAALGGNSTPATIGATIIAAGGTLSRGGGHRAGMASDGMHSAGEDGARDHGAGERSVPVGASRGEPRPIGGSARVLMAAGAIGGGHVPAEIVAGAVSAATERGQTVLLARR